MELQFFPELYLTIEVALLSLLLAMTLGMLGALAKMAPYRWARAVATLYTTIIRGIPDLVLMYAYFLWWSNTAKQ